MIFLLNINVFSSEKRHNATFHPKGIFRHHWISMFTYLFTFLFTWKVLWDLDLDLNLESAAGFKFGFEFGLKLNLNWNFEVFFKKCLGSP